MVDGQFWYTGFGRWYGYYIEIVYNSWLGVCLSNMNKFSALISIHSSNNATKPRPVYIEPWGEDYWLFPGDKFEIIANGIESSPYFSIGENDENIQVYIEGDCQDFSVRHVKKVITCGYQRPEQKKLKS